MPGIPHFDDTNAEGTPRIVATSAPLTRNAALAGMLGGQITRARGSGDASAIIIGWGYKPSGQRALATAGQYADHWLLEDGFLRSVGRRDEALGVNFDKLGIYYAANSPSRLFDLIARALSEEERGRTQHLIQLWRDNRVSKYNDAPPLKGELPEGFVLVVDQVRDDQSISHGLASADTFDHMLAAALAENPDAPIVVKIHPDSVNNPSKRHFDPAQLAADPRIIVIAEACHIVDLIERASVVYTVTSQVGFEGLIWGKPVRTFGMPFYAGWGLTQDDLTAPEIRGATSLEQLVHAALVDYPRYWHPMHQEVTTPEAIIRLIGINRRIQESQPATIYAHGFSRWKKPFMAKFLAGSDVKFVKTFASVPDGAHLLIWGRKPAPDNRDFQILRAEDGFLRSSGLGADLVRPLSLVVDDLGIYFDSTQASRLEAILATHDFSDEEREEAAALRQGIIAARLSKYNLGGDLWCRPETDRQVLLVVGQVEADASIRFGSPQIASNLGLIQQVRADHPDAYLVYKPHPDVVAGLREVGSDEQRAGEICDEVVTVADTMQMLEEVDQVHTMTSLLGFEALLRGVPVTCYGQPFYSSWGLTNDRLPVERRTRQLQLDDLVYGALIAYPRYFSPRCDLFVSPQDILRELAELVARGPQTRTLYRKALRAVVVHWAAMRRRLGLAV